MYIHLMKVCSTCRLEKELSNFYNNRSTKDGKHGACKVCMNLAYKPKTKEQQNRDVKAYANRHPERVKRAWAEYYSKNKESLRIRREQSPSAVSTAQKAKEWRLKNKEHLNNLRKLRRVNPTPEQKIEKCLRDRFNKIIIRMKSGIKHTSCLNLVGCTFDELKHHIESQFTDGMSWANHGNGDDKWNIDHIIPLCIFDLNLLDQQVIAFNYQNLRPLWFTENMSRPRKHYKNIA